MPVTNIRQIRIRPSDDDSEVTVPADVVAMFGPDAKLELRVEPGMVTIRRPGPLRQSDLKAAAKPVKTAEQLMRHATTPLSDTERTALNEFLNG